MGKFHVHVDAVGGHGCQREVKDGETVAESCGNQGCVDCITREYIGKLRSAVATFTSASLTHWPGTSLEVRDDLLTGRRSGSFG